MNPPTHHISQPFKLIPLLVFALFATCQTHIKPQVETSVINPYKSIDKISDSVFFTLIGKISGLNEIDFLDVNAKRLIVCDRNLKLKKVIGRWGKGPGELIYPSSSYSIGNQYFIRDGNQVKKFDSSGRYINSIPVPPDYNVVRFIVGQDGIVYTNSLMGSDKPLCAVSPDGKILFSFGLNYKTEGSGIQTRISQSRHLFSFGPDRIISIGNNYPSFEVYDLKGKLINSQIIDDQLISEDYKDLQERQLKDPTSTIDLFCDVYLLDHSVYFLNSLRKTDGTIKYYLITGEIKSDKLTISQHLEIISDDKAASWNDLCVLNNHDVIIYDLNTLAFHYFIIPDLSHQ